MRSDRSRYPSSAAIAACVVIAVALTVPAVVPATDQPPASGHVPDVGGPAVDDPTYGKFTEYELDMKSIRGYFDALDMITELPGELHRQAAVEKSHDETIQDIVQELGDADPQVLHAISKGGLTLYDYAMIGNTVMDAYITIHRGDDTPRDVNPNNVELVRENWSEINRRYNAIRLRVTQSARDRVGSP